MALLLDTCILLITMFWCRSLHLLMLEQETAEGVPWLQPGRSCSQTHVPCAHQKKIEDLPGFSSRAEDSAGQQQGAGLCHLC